MALFTLVRHSAFAEAANPAYENALEAAEVEHAYTNEVQSVGGLLYPSRTEAEAAIPGARGYFSHLRIAGAEVFVSLRR